MKYLIFAVMASSVLTGCVDKQVPVSLYDLETSEILPAQFHFFGTTSGNINFTLPSGETFTGQYFTERGGSSTWGNVYGKVWDGYGSVNYSGHGRTRTLPSEYVGTAAGVSDQGRSMTCEYTTNTSITTPHGHGVCKDNNGKVYKLMY
jgi:hypothetical protein